MPGSKSCRAVFTPRHGQTVGHNSIWYPVEVHQSTRKWPKYWADTNNGLRHAWHLHWLLDEKIRLVRVLIKSVGKFALHMPAFDPKRSLGHLSTGSKVAPPPSADCPLLRNFCATHDRSGHGPQNPIELGRARHKTFSKSRLPNLF